MFLILGILIVSISGSFGYYYPPLPYGISQKSWPQQRTQNSNYNYYNNGYNSMQQQQNSAYAFSGTASGNPTFSSSSSSGNRYFHQRAQYCADLRLFREAYFLLQKADLNQTDIDLILEQAKAWNIEGIKNEIYDIVNSKFETSDRNRSLELLDILSPPRSFTDALEVLTVEQKAHIKELFETYRYQDLGMVISGLIKSLPDSDQRQARRFVQAVHYISKQFSRPY